MKKAIVCALVAAVSVAALVAGPFGLEMGMSLDEVTQACGGRTPVDIGGDRYIITPQKANPFFAECIAWVSESEGLIAVRANGEDVLSTPEGDQLRGEFSAVQQALEALYGEAHLTSESTEEQHVLQADWFPEGGDVEWVCLVAEGAGSSAYLFVQYTFSNYQSAQETSQQAQSGEDVF